MVNKTDAGTHKNGTDNIEYQLRTYHDDNTATPGWSQWQKLEPRLGSDIETRIREIIGYINDGKKYQLRRLDMTFIYPV